MKFILSVFLLTVVGGVASIPADPGGRTDQAANVSIQADVLDPPVPVAELAPQLLCINCW